MFGFMGSIATMLFITVVPRFFIFAALWAIIGNVGLQLLYSYIYAGSSAHVL